MCVSVALLCGVELVQAHVFNPGLLEINQQPSDIYTVRWRPPGIVSSDVSGRPVLPQIQFPTQCEVLAAAVQPTEFATLRCPIGPSDQAEIVVVSNEIGTWEVIVRFMGTAGGEHTMVLSDRSRRLPWPGEAGPSPGSDATTFGTYLRLGVDHIVFGFDHLLFVFGLLLLIRRRRILIGAITAFTLAHSLTLCLAMTTSFSLPSGPVEILIALSIVLLAVEKLREWQGVSGLTTRRPWLASFAFGLLHGFGFAGMLAEIGLPADGFPLALFSFNLGVELGQIAFVLVMLLPLAWLRSRTEKAPVWLQRVPAYGMGTVATFWVVTRIQQLV